MEHNPDIYCRVLNALLDNGELRIGQLRALLDRIGARNAPIGAYTDMAINRGDAIRLEDRLILQPAALKRADVALDGVMVAFSDSAYRAWLTLVQRDPNLFNPVERRDFWSLGNRFAAWDMRIFGNRQNLSTIQDSLGRVLSGRSLNLIPIAQSAPKKGPPVSQPFIDCLDQEGMVITFPLCLGELAGGVTSINAVLRRNRAAPAGVRMPSPVDSRAQIHGGLLHPGEIQPKAFADNFSIRLRALTHLPAMALLGSLLILDRRQEASLELQATHSGPNIHWAGQNLGSCTAHLSALFRVPRLVAFDARTSGLTGLILEALGRALGIATRVNDRLLLDEASFFDSR